MDDLQKLVFWAHTLEMKQKMILKKDLTDISDIDILIDMKKNLY